MKKLILLLFLPFSVKAISYVTCTGVTTGNWNTTSTWALVAAPTVCGVAVPGLGDIASIADGATITISDSRVIGNSPTAGNIVLQLNNTGNVTINNGGTLTLRGDCSYTAGNSNLADYLDINAGGTFIFDATLAVSPSTTNYSCYPSADAGFRLLVTTGTSLNHVTVKSNNAAASGSFKLGPSGSYGGLINATYTDFSYLGTATIDAWQVGINGSVGTLNFTITHSNFDHCGYIEVISYLPPTANWNTSFNNHTNTMGNGIYWLRSLVNRLSGGSRVMSNNAFDISTDINNDPTDFTMQNNYHGAFYFISTVVPAVTLNNSFLRTSTTDPNPTWTITSTSSGLYFFIDHGAANPHVTQESNNATVTLNNSIFGKSGPTPTDTGELLCNRATGGASTMVGNNLINLPDASGFTFAEWASLVVGDTCIIKINHSTKFGGYSLYPINSSNQAISSIQLGEGGASPIGSLGGYTNNIDWNPEVSSASFYKVGPAAGFVVGSITLDVGTPSNIDYNDGWPSVATNLIGPGAIQSDTYDTFAASFTNQGKSYASAWSATPGTHDITADPMFIDYKRSVELYDNKVLGISGITWTGGASPTIGQVYTNSRSDHYWGLPINYRYINSSGCGGANPEPGNEAASPAFRTCWEWNILNLIRLGTTGISGSSTIITDINTWVQNGFKTSNVLLQNAGNDGQTIGASDFQSSGGANSLLLLGVH